VIFVLACEALLFLAHDTRAAEIIFDRDIRPLLAEKCFACHGPDAQEVKGDLRLDLQDSVLKKDGTGAIVPGDAKASELVRRVLSPDDGERMPPPDSHKTLTTAEIQSLEQWIEQGAIYSEHWAFLPTQRPVPPDVRTPHFVRNAIDSFVLAALEANGLQPSTQAGPETLMRRVSLDVRGLPPTLAELDEYLHDKQPDAYERMVERMLARPHYGEKMALLWMDLARYGDTSGYHLDSTRDSWPWRDWVSRPTTPTCRSIASRSNSWGATSFQTARCSRKLRRVLIAMRDSMRRAVPIPTNGWCGMRSTERLRSGESG